MRDHNLSRRSFVGLGCAGLGGLALAGCGSSDGDSSSETSESVMTNVSDGTGGRAMRVACASSAGSLDPSTATTGLALSANRCTLEGLYSIDFHSYDTFAELAAGDPTEVDGSTLEVSLRDGATFCDGTPVTPADVVASFDRCMQEGSVYQPFLAPISSIEAKDDSTLTVHLATPGFSLARQRLALVRVAPATASDDELAQGPVGSGPWMYESVTDAQVRLVPNPNYDGSHPALDSELDLLVTEDANERMEVQTEGSTLAAEAVPAASIEELEAAGCTVDVVQGAGMRFLMFDVAKAPWDDVRVRQAVMYALDYDQIVDGALAGMASVPTSLLPDGFPGYHEAARVYTHDPDTARDLLSQASVTPGAVTLLAAGGDDVAALAEQVRSDLEAVGFSVTVETDAADALYARIDEGDSDYDLLLGSGDPSRLGGDADLLLRWWCGDNVWMRTRCPWASSDEWAQLGSLMDQALALSGDERQQLWNQCFDLLSENVPLYPVAHVKVATASWRDGPNSAGVRIEGFQGIGTTGLSLLDCATQE